MKLTGRTGFIAIGVLAVAAAGILGSRVFTAARAPAAAPCSNDPRLALGCYGDFARVFALCAGVGAPFRKNCYQSLGRDAATMSRDQVPATMATCKLGVGHEQRSSCVLGAVLDFVYYYHSDVQAKALCDALERDLQQGCRSAIARLVGRF